MGMAGRNRGPVLRCQNALGRPRVVPQWDRRILDDAGLIAALSQDLVDASPASTVHKATMHENNVLQACHLPSPSVSAFRAGWSKPRQLPESIPPISVRRGATGAVSVRTTHGSTAIPLSTATPLCSGLD